MKKTKLMHSDRRNRKVCERPWCIEGIPIGSKNWQDAHRKYKLTWKELKGLGFKPKGRTLCECAECLADGTTSRDAHQEDRKRKEPPTPFKERRASPSVSKKHRVSPDKEILCEHGSASLKRILVWLLHLAQMGATDDEIFEAMEFSISIQKDSW